jgi:hypothetical protein
MTTLGIVSDGVVGLQTNPLRNRTVLLHLFGQAALEPVGLVSRLCKVRENLNGLVNCNLKIIIVNMMRTAQKVNLFKCTIKSKTD